MRLYTFIRKLLIVFLPIFLQAAEQKTVAIMTYHAEGLPADQTWDPDSIKSGITGSEEAVIYMSAHLVELGYKVTVFGKPPAGSIYSDSKANPRYLSTRSFDPKKDSYDIAISWRMPVLAQELKKCAKKVYFWPHDRTFPLMIAKEQIEAFDDVLWVSEWQRKEWIAKNPDFSKFTNISGNGVNPTQFKRVTKRKNPYSCIYGSNYGQGLSVLLDIWPTIKEKFPKATLDIYYGWRHFGFLTAEQEAKMKQQVEDLKPLGVVDHDMVGHLELNEAYSKASFWTYPCIGTETFSITALRAQISGAIPVIIEGSALVESVGSGYKCQTANDYCDTLIKAMENAEKINLKTREKTRDFVLQNHTWQQVALRWNTIFKGGEK